MEGNFPSTTIGWTAIASGITAILAIVFLGMMATVNIFFGTLNDILNSVLAILIAVLAWMLYTQFHAKAPLMSQVTLVLAVLGAILAVVGSVLVIFRFTGFVLAGWYTGFGYALLGLWLAAFCYSILGSGVYPNKWIIFGIVIGIAMVAGILSLSGILSRIDSMEALPWYLNVAYLAFLGIYILYPIWAIWLGRVLLQK